MAAGLHRRFGMATKNTAKIAAKNAAKIACVNEPLDVLLQLDLCIIQFLLGGCPRSGTLDGDGHNHGNEAKTRKDRTY